MTSCPTYLVFVNSKKGWRCPNILSKIHSFHHKHGGRCPDFALKIYVFVVATNMAGDIVTCHFKYPVFDAKHDGRSPCQELLKNTL